MKVKEYVNKGNMLSLKYLVISGLVFLLSCKTNHRNEKGAFIFANQLGFYPKSQKVAVIANTTDSVFTVKNIIGKVILVGKLSEQVYYDKSGEQVRLADFSALQEPGKYLLIVNDAEKEFVFEIKANLYSEAFIAVLKNYYYQRSGITIDEKYAGMYKRNAGHPDTLCQLHPSSLRGNGTISSPKGWYDAGDYNKYVVNAGVTVGTILNFFEMFPEIVKDGACNIPESGNGISDLLDEIRYELEWVLSMQTPDGASNHKLTSKYFTGFDMPEKDNSERFIVGKSSAATLNLAAMTAQAARIFKSVDKDFAEKCIIASEKAWNWAIKNPDKIFKNPDDVQTGEYGDKNLTEEFWWAASELYVSTRKSEYLNYLTGNEPYIEMKVGESWCNFIGNLGNFSILLADSGISNELKQNISAKLVALAENLIIRKENNPYRIAIDEFHWGSNSDVLNTALIFAQAYKLTGNEKYLTAIIESTDYLFGKNPTGYSFVTGFGSKSPKNIHHRPSGADKIEEPIPGFIVGGPNSGRQDGSNNVRYSDTFPAKCYMDVEASYASNEVCINWNAPAVFVLGFLEANHDKLQ